MQFIKIVFPADMINNHKLFKKYKNELACKYTYHSYMTSCEDHTKYEYDLTALIKSIDLKCGFFSKDGTKYIILYNSYNTMEEYEPIKKILVKFTKKYMKKKKDLTMVGLSDWFNKKIEPIVVPTSYNLFSL